MLAAWWGPTLASSIVLTQSWTPRTSLYLKPTIYTPPWWFHEGAAEKHRLHETGLKTRAAPGCPFNFIDTMSFSNMMKRE
jgi:hypothetical protein